MRRECHSRVPSSQSAVTVAPAHMMDGVVFNASLVEMFESVVEKGTLSHEGCVKKSRIHTHTHTNTHLLKSHINHSEKEKGAPGLVWSAGKKSLFNHSWLPKNGRA